MGKLTDLKCKNAKPKEKEFKLFDGQGLSLLVKPNGKKHWRYYYRFNNRYRVLAFGEYPLITLEEARQKHFEARRHIQNGVDPAELRKQEKAAGTDLQRNTFEALAREWFVKNQQTWADNHAKTIIRRLERDIFPFLGERHIASIKGQDVLQALKRVEDRGAIETAHRIKGICGQVFRYAFSQGLVEFDPTSNLRGALTPVVTSHHAAITEPNQVGELLRAIEGYQGSFIVKCALKIAPYLFVRPGELRHMKWAEVNFDKAEWIFFHEKQSQAKAQKDTLIVPLATQSLEILRELYPVTSGGEYVFPSERSKS